MVVRVADVFKRDLTLAQEYLGFLLLNLADLFLTGWIFRHSGQEANGIANLVLKYFHLTGFALFKFIMVVLIIMICELISLKNTKTARTLVMGASMLYLAVVIYECFLIWLYIERPPDIKHALGGGYMAFAGSITPLWDFAMHGAKSLCTNMPYGWVNRG